MGVLKKLLPAKSRAEDMSVVVDLDDLVTKPVGFRFQGRLYTVEPVSAKTFMELAEILGEIQVLVNSVGQGKPIHDVEIYDAYYRYISVLVPDFSVDTLKQMHLPQVHALVNLIIKHATGQPMNLDALEKKKMTLQTPS